MTVYLRCGPMPDHMKTFKCRQFHCAGVTPAMCIKRQWALTPGEGGVFYGEKYPGCRDCEQGDEVAAFHSDLVPDRPKPGNTSTNNKCPICGDPFYSKVKNQKTCTRECGHVSRREAQLINNAHRSSHPSFLNERTPGGRVLPAPPSNKVLEVSSPAPTPQKVSR